MIKVDISNVWGQVTLSDLLAMEKEVAAAHTTLADGTGAGNDFLGWQNLPVREATEEITRIQRAAEKIRSDSDVFVVIGIGGSYLGPRAAIELLQGPNHNIGKGKGNPQIFFAGNGLSTRHWNELTRLLEGKDFSIAIISKSGTTTEPAIATRALRWMLERKYGTEGAKSRIYAITDPCKGALRQMATEEGWETFVIPPDVGGRYSVLTPVGPLAMERLQYIRGVDTPTVLVVVYGNRAYEKALMELDAFAIPHGLKVIAGATFIGEHSYSTDKHPIAMGRPDESDLAFATEFGKKIMEKIQAADSMDTLYPVDVRAIKRPSQPFFPLFRFLRKVIKLRKSGTPLPRTPWVEDENLCTHCGLCVVRCPAGAITKGDELHTDEAKCIKCCACVKACVKKARVYDTPFAALLSDCFKKQKLPQTIL